VTPADYMLVICTSLQTDNNTTPHHSIFTDALPGAQPTVSKHTHTHPFNGPFSGSTQVSRYQKGTTNLDFTGARDSEWQWRQLGHMQVCTLLQTDNHASTPPLSFLQAGCPSCHPTNSVKALKASYHQSLQKHYSLSSQCRISTAVKYLSQVLAVIRKVVRDLFCPIHLFIM